MPNEILNLLPSVQIVDGKSVTTSHEIARVFKKRHDHVLEAVRQRMEDSGNWGLQHFRDTLHTDPQNGQTYPVIQMTQTGYMFVVQKFTGAKAAKVQLAYAKEFDRMEQKLASLGETDYGFKSKGSGLTLEQAKSDHYSQDITVQVGLELVKEIGKGTAPQEAFQTALNAANNKVRSTSYVNVTTLTEALNYSEDLTGSNRLTPVLTNQILLKAGLQVRGPVCSSASGWVSTAAGADLSISNPYIDPKGWKPPTPALNWLEAETVEHLQGLPFPDSKDLAAIIREVQERSKLVSVTALTKTLAQHFKLHLQPKNVNKVLRELGLQRVHHYGWEPTDFGSEMCEAQPTDDHLRPFLLWNEASLMEYLTGDQYDHHRTIEQMLETYSDSVPA